MPHDQRLGDHHHHHHQQQDQAHQCNCTSTPAPATQSLDELEFERGIWTAAIDNDTSKLTTLIGRGHLNDRDQSGYTALHYAARCGHQEICRRLLDSGIGVDEQTHGGATALHRAAMMGHSKIVKLLLERKSNPLLQDSDGKTALHRAVERGHLETCQILLENHRAAATIRDNKGNTPLELISVTSPHKQQFDKLFSV
ncbi:ankyrin repeat domain-containing protein 39-like [Uranotaenia lowii]|uniref:ankyrin repeat domain-containing protein 39-like n=1 Tax=Uranotaenia lowii TaxID=190385 RepID=UPI00247A8B4B|nr:ankyrin repeat domain-containing protein 39-like [Uranotaenia lowii]XP_055596301.1 ankyrin repeat domain-containing protein 39-like [Uranotaenia lowii]XP_055596302.1 ankyrin repeat domain-containing protein 39-like [Uranotaenia lowii]